jgi:hypothetical protein
LLDEVVDQLTPRNLAPELDDTVLDVDVDVALRDVRIPEDLTANLVCERRVVVVLRLLLQVLHPLREAVGIGRRCAARLAGASAA